MENAACCVTGLSLSLMHLCTHAYTVSLHIYITVCSTDTGEFLCGNSSAAGDWVNCGICGEWAHFGCDRRQGLGAFKVCLLKFFLSRDECG